MADFDVNTTVNISVFEFFNEMSSREKVEMRKLLKEDKTPLEDELDPTSDISMNGHEKQLEQAFILILENPNINHLELAIELEDRFNL